MQPKKPTQCPICAAAAIRSVAYLVQFACGSRSNMVLLRDNWRLTRVCRRRTVAIAAGRQCGKGDLQLLRLIKSHGLHAKAGDIMTRRLNEILEAR